jgi:hypothetical protein
MVKNCLLSLLSLTQEQQSQLQVVDERIKKHEQDLTEHQQSYHAWSQKKADIILEWAHDLEVKYTILGKPVDNIARDIVDRMKFLNIASGGESWVYKSLPTEFKRNYEYGTYFTHIHDTGLEKSNLDKSTLLNKKWDSLQTVDEKVEYVTEKSHEAREARKKAEQEGIDLTKPKTGPRVTQGKPPAEQQGESEFSKELELTGEVVLGIADNIYEIAKKVKVYKPLDPTRDKEMSKAWKESVREGIFDVVRRFFVPAKDDKWSLGIMRWFEVMEDRIKQSKHAAGKMNEDYVTDPITGNVLYDDKGHPKKRFISRERVGDAELPLFKFAIKLIRAFKGLAWLEYWVEKDIGGYRRHRKYVLHDYFSEVAFGSQASGGPDVEEEEEEKEITHEEAVQLREQLEDAGLEKSFEEEK